MQDAKDFPPKSQKVIVLSGARVTEICFFSSVPYPPVENEFIFS